ncbi:MAG: hypothetical protein MJ252_17905, partial [archaeon]|nr:hypothetical protein [archaeon]
QPKIIKATNEDFEKTFKVSKAQKRCSVALIQSTPLTHLHIKNLVNAKKRPSQIGPFLKADQEITYAPSRETKVVKTQRKSVKNPTDVLGTIANLRESKYEFKDNGNEKSKSVYKNRIRVSKDKLKKKNQNIGDFLKKIRDSSSNPSKSQGKTTAKNLLKNSSILINSKNDGGNSSRGTKNMPQKKNVPNTENNTNYLKITSIKNLDLVKKKLSLHK